MAKNIIPSLTFDTELTAGGISAAVKTAGGEKITSNEGGLFRVPASQLHVLPGFNVRVHGADYDEQVEELMRSIRSEGFMKTKPLTVFVAKEDAGDVIYVTDGHRRLEAVNNLLAEGVEVGALPVIMSPSTMTLEDHLVSLATSNQGAPLTMFEKALLAKRLDNMGIEHPRIASRLGFTDRHLHNMLVLSSAPSKIRNAIVDGKISATEALKQMKLKGKGASDAVEKGISDAAKVGKKKATARTIDAGAVTDTKPPREAGQFVVVEVEAKFEAGAVTPADNILAFARFANGDWYSWVDKKTKKEAFIEYDISFRVQIVTKAPVVVEEPADDNPVVVEGGEGGEPADAEALADETFETVANGAEPEPHTEVQPEPEPQPELVTDNDEL